MPSQRRSGSTQAVQERGIHTLNDQERLQAARAQRLIHQAQENPQAGVPRNRLGQKSVVPPGRHSGASTAPRQSSQSFNNQRSGSNTHGNNRGSGQGARNSSTLPPQSAQPGSSHVVQGQRTRSASTSNDKHTPLVNNTSRKSSDSQVIDANQRQRSVSASEVLNQPANTVNAHRTVNRNNSQVNGESTTATNNSNTNTSGRQGSANNSVFVAPSGSTSRSENRQQSGVSDNTRPSSSSQSGSPADPNIVRVQYVKSSTRQGNNERSSNSSPRSQNVSEQRGTQPESNNLDILNDSRSNRDSPLSEEQVQVNLSERNDQNSRVQMQQPTNNPQTNEALPDILNSHRVGGAPPYVPRPNQHRASRNNNRNHRGRSSRPPRGSVHGATQLEEDEGKGLCTKECCISCVTVVTTFRWVLVTLAMLGVCCVATGIILGALHMTSVGESYLTLSLMFIGLGVMLVVVVGVGWRCTPPGHEPCHLLFNLGEHTTRVYYGRGAPRHRERGWMGGMMYNEFQYRRPPPSYNASMQEHQQQLAAAHNVANRENIDNVSLPSSPPPTYRSRASTVRTGVQITFPPTPQGGDYPSSGPPTYRSRISTNQRPSLEIEVSAVDVGIDNPALDSDPGESISARQSPERNLGTPDSNLQAPLGDENSTLPPHVRVVEYLEGMQGTEQEAVSNGESLDSADPCQEQIEQSRNRTLSMNSDVERVADTRL